MCDFTDGSSDGKSSITDWNWDFEGSKELRSRVPVTAMRLPALKRSASREPIDNIGASAYFQKLD